MLDIYRALFGISLCVGPWLKINANPLAEVMSCSYHATKDPAVMLIFLLASRSLALRDRINAFSRGSDLLTRVSKSDPLLKALDFAIVEASCCGVPKLVFDKPHLTKGFHLFDLRVGGVWVCREEQAYLAGDQ